MTYCLLAIMVFGSMASVADQQAIDTDLCNLVAHPKQFDHKEVRVRAQLLQSMHGSVLTDEHCQKGVALWYLKEAQNHADFKALDDILFHHGTFGTLDMRVIATFTGKFFRKKTSNGIHKKTMVLEASKIENLDVHYDNPP
jgi:hypothetical protein